MEQTKNTAFKGYKALTTLLKEIDIVNAYCDTPIAVRLLMQHNILDGVSTGNDIVVQRPDGHFSSVGLFESKGAKGYIIVDETLKQAILGAYETSLEPTEAISLEPPEKVAFIPSEESDFVPSEESDF